MNTARSTINAASLSAKSIAYHDTLADSWTERYARGGFKRRADFFTEAVLSKVPTQGIWIDVGCGSGYFSRLLAQRGLTVLGVDGSAEMIKAARAAPAAVPKPRYEVKTVEDLADAESLYDGALCLSVLEYLDNPAATVAAIARMLKPGGHLILSAPNKTAGLRRLQSAIRRLAAVFGSTAFNYLDSSKQVWSRVELTALVQTHGLSCETILGFDPVAPRLLWGLVSPSLFFLVCRKIETPPSR